MSDTVLLDIDDTGLATVTLNRPEVGNALSSEMSTRFREVIVTIAADPSVRAVLLKANGRVWFGGGDLSEFADKGDGSFGHLSDMTVDFHAGISRMTKMDPPVVAAVTGAAGGAGMSLVSACDMVVCGEGSKFTMGYTRAGLTPDGSSTFFLARVVGLRRAMDLTLTNRLLSADEAEGWGLVNRVVPNDDVVAEAEKLARELAAGPTLTLGEAKRLLYEGATRSLESAMEQESLSIARASLSADAKEGMAAFIEKRAPDFKGN
ncbi:MAG: enoyl-CoA hydratase [Actinomycetia bacterium]|nr:enoyl-CoA hydratase [Actinomycetes bacterium]MCP3912060.1 enoyl-CoA hydratase [Actinomycetes bacterium]MCP4086363.1 enoyl-CoA hydratase [Actinomycetes bacterium]